MVLQQIASKMPASIGVNLRVTGHCRQGGRKYMEDFFSVAYQQTEDERDLEYAFFGIYDGHGGAEAAAFAKEHLMDAIVKHKHFWSDNDEDVLRAIKDGYMATHYAMWREQDKWPKTASGLPSTAGTTASIAFIRRGKIYIGHVGDSGIILAYQEPGCPEWKARPLTRDHKPECAQEMSRIESCGGKVVSKSGVPRVVWNRPRIGHKGPVRRSTPIDEIPFLAVARSLGDLWSYNSQLDEFVVSPDPDCSVIPIDTSSYRCLIFGTDGLYNMLSPQAVVSIVQSAERHNENTALSDSPNKGWLNPSKCLVERALERWNSTKMRADNTSVVTIMLDPPGPPRAQVLRNRKKNYAESGGLQILTRYENHPERTPLQTYHQMMENIHRSPDSNNKNSTDYAEYVPYNPGLYNYPVAATNNVPTPLDTTQMCNIPPPSTYGDVHKTETDQNLRNFYYSRFSEIMQKSSTSCSSATSSPINTKSEPNPEQTGGGISDLSRSNFFSQCDFEQFERKFIPKARESTSYDPRVFMEAMEASANAARAMEMTNLVAADSCHTSRILQKIETRDEENIQINEISSSSNDSFENLDAGEDANVESTSSSAETHKKTFGKTKRVGEVKPVQPKEKEIIEKKVLRNSNGSSLTKVPEKPKNYQLVSSSSKDTKNEQENREIGNTIEENSKPNTRNRSLNNKILAVTRRQKLCENSKSGNIELTRMKRKCSNSSIAGPSKRLKADIPEKSTFSITSHNETEAKSLPNKNSGRWVEDSIESRLSLESVSSPGLRSTRLLVLKKNDNTEANKSKDLMVRSKQPANVKVKVKRLQQTPKPEIIKAETRSKAKTIVINEEKKLQSDKVDEYPSCSSLSTKNLMRRIINEKKLSKFKEETIVKVALVGRRKSHNKVTKDQTPKRTIVKTGVMKQSLQEVINNTINREFKNISSNKAKKEPLAPRSSSTRLTTNEAKKITSKIRAASKPRVPDPKLQKKISFKTKGNSTKPQVKVVKVTVGNKKHQKVKVVGNTKSTTSKTITKTNVVKKPKSVTRSKSVLSFRNVTRSTLSQVLASKRLLLANDIGKNLRPAKVLLKDK